MSSAGSGCELWSSSHLFESCRIIQPETQKRVRAKITFMGFLTLNRIECTQQPGTLANCQLNRIDHLYGDASGLIQTSGVSQLHSLGCEVVHSCHGDMPGVRPGDKKSITA